MGGAGSSLSKVNASSTDHLRSTCRNPHTEEILKTVLFVECTTDLDLKCTTGLLKSVSPRFRVHVTMPEFSNMERIVDMTVKHLNKDLFFHALDVSDENAIVETVRNVASMEKNIDILVCSFDTRITSNLDAMSMEEVHSAFSRNLYSHIRIVQHVIPLMKRQRTGTIIALSNVAGIQGLPYHSVYCSTKFALEGFYESIAAECASHNIHVTILETAVQKDSDITSLDLMVDRRLCIGSSGEEASMMAHVESRLADTGLKKNTKPEKVVEAIQDICTTRKYCVRRFLNKSVLNVAKSRFSDSKGRRQLNEVMKFFLNTDLENIKNTGGPFDGFLRRTRTL